jgi:hypothetical protein
LGLWLTYPPFPLYSLYTYILYSPTICRQIVENIVYKYI